MINDTIILGNFGNEDGATKPRVKLLNAIINVNQLIKSFLLPILSDHAPKNGPVNKTNNVANENVIPYHES